MIHKCNVQCHTVNPTEMDLLGLKEDAGKWLPFAISLDVINAMKMSTDEKGEPTYKCTTIFCTDGSTFIIYTPYDEMVTKWSNYVNFTWEIGEEGTDDDDIIL